MVNLPVAGNESISMTKMMAQIRKENSKTIKENAEEERRILG